MAIDWPTVGTTVLGSGAVAAAVTQGFAALREHSKQKVEGWMVALSTALALEEFGSACAEVVADTANYHYSNGTLGRARAELPTLQDFKTGFDLTLLPLKISSALLEFQASVGCAKVDLQAELTADYFELAMPIFLRMGLVSFELGHEVRARTGLPALRSRELDQGLKYLLEQRQLFEDVDGSL